MRPSTASTGSRSQRGVRMRAPSIAASAVPAIEPSSHGTGMCA